MYNVLNLSRFSKTFEKRAWVGACTHEAHKRGSFVGKNQNFVLLTWPWNDKSL